MNPATCHALRGWFLTLLAIAAGPFGISAARAAQADQGAQTDQGAQAERVDDTVMVRVRLLELAVLFVMHSNIKFNQ